MASFALPAFFCVAVLSSMTLVSHGAEIRLCQGPCLEGWVHYNGNCFQHVADAKTWLDAERNCLHLGGNLASEHSEDEHQFLKELHKSLDPKNGPFWIGLSDNHEEGTWLWSDGTSAIAKWDFLRWYGQTDTHKEKTWLWSDGTSASAKGNFLRWNPGEPNNNGGKEGCVHSNYGDKKGWNDTSCNSTYPSICALRFND